MTSAKEIHVILAAIPFYGHVRPLRSLAESLVHRNYRVSFVTGSAFRDFVEAVPGITFVPLQGKADIDPDHFEEQFPGRKDYDGLEKVFFDFREVFFGTMRGQFDAVQEVLKAHQGERNVVLSDGSFTGNMPMLLSSPLSVPHVPTIGIGHFPLVINSVDTAPFGAGLPPQGREQNIAMNEQAVAMFEPVAKDIDRILETFEWKKQMPFRYPPDSMVALNDLYCQMSVPALEPSRSDLPANVRFVGTLTGGNDRRAYDKPEWFDDFILNDTSNRPLIMVTSGTLGGLSASDLILPTIEACKSLPVRLVVCGVRVNQPSDFELPSNARWAKWIPFEDLFPHTSIVVSSGGYGGISQAFACGIPMILAGTSEDKAETNLRASWTGAAINLQTQTATVEQVRNAVEKMLAKGSGFKEKAMAVKKQYEACDAVGSFVSAIDELAEKFYGAKA